MARTYSKTPEPRYVERAKYADNGGGGGGPEIFEARFNNTTYEEIDAAHNAGKLILLKDDSDRTYVAGMPWADGENYTFYGVNATGAILLVIVDSDGWRTGTISNTEIFDAIYEETTYEELKAAYDAGKLIYLRYSDGEYISAIAHYDRGPIQFCSQIDDTYCQIFTCNRDDSWTQELVEFQKAGLIVHLTMTSQTTATADVSVGEIYNAFSTGRSVMINVNFLGADTCIKLSVAQYDPQHDTYNAEWISVSRSSGDTQLYVGLTNWLTSEDTNWNLYVYNLTA